MNYHSLQHKERTLTHCNTRQNPGEPERDRQCSRLLDTLCGQVFYDIVGVWECLKRQKLYREMQATYLRLPRLSDGSYQAVGGL